MFAVYIGIITLFVTIPCAWLSPAHYEITPINSNPGIYYEKLPSVRIQRGNWKVIIHLDLHTFLKEHGPTRTYNEQLTQCITHLGTDHCNAALNKDLMEAKLKTLDHIHEDIKQAAISMDTQPKEDPSSIQNIRARRMAPLGIIGSVSKSLFGLITTDDADAINRNIDQLFKDQKKLVKLSVEKTHLLSANLDELYNMTKLHRETTKRMGENLNNKLNAVMAEANENHLAWELSTFARQMETKLDHLIHCNREILTIISTLIERKLHPKLLRHDVLQQIAMDIQQTGESRVLPMPLNHLRPEEIAKIATLDATFHDGRVLISLTIPLTERSTYELYRLHPVRIPQALKNQSFGVAHISPSYPYLAVKRDLQEYLKLTEQHLQECIATHYGRICPPKGPLFIISDRKECEVELLLNPHPGVLKSGDIMISSSSSSQWRYLELTDSWLYSIVKEETVRITCPGEIYYTPTIKGTGMLRLANGCSARTHTVELPDNQDQTAKAQYIYNPDVGLNITNIHPELWQYTNLSTPLEMVQTSSDTVFTPRIERLSNIVSRMKEIGEHKRSTTYTQQIVYGGLTCQGILVALGALTFALYKRTKRRRSQVTLHHAQPRDALTAETPLTYIAVQPMPSRSVSTPALMPPVFPLQLAETD